MNEKQTNRTFENCLQSLYAGEIVTLIEIDGTKFGAQKYCFHNENIAFTPEELMTARQTGELPEKNIIFRGEVFGARPFGISGITFTSNGKAGKPQLTVSNLDSRVSALIRAYNGMMQAKVIIWVTAKEFLNDDGTVKDGAFRKMVYYIERPSFCNKTIAQFDLTSPYDMDGIMIPARITQSSCFWAQRGWYRSGKGCGYNGNRMFDKDNNPVTDPSLDFCAGTPTACKLRFGEDQELDFGGAPVASLLRSSQ
ncbi:tail tip protein L [Hafnia phage Pocis76]|uniref:Tail tip protein L n=1 Tax=Hafnia phage Pocis76 TaxID=2831174 RepID=A0A8E7FNS2_9CAUD|nr:tail tip protein L [Hafnia phage Pocis76]